MNNLNTNASSSTQAVPHIPNNPSPNRSTQHNSKLSPTELLLAQAATGTTIAGGTATVVTMYNKDQREERLDQLNINTKAVEIRNAYKNGTIDQKDAIYNLHNLTLTEQEVIKHLRSVDKCNLDPKTNYRIDNFELVPIKTSKDGQIDDPFFAVAPNKASLNELGNLQNELYEQRGQLKQYKATLPTDSPLHSSLNEGITTFNQIIKDTKEMQLFNASEVKGDLRTTRFGAKAIKDQAAAVITNVNASIEAHKDNVPQHELGNIIHPEKASSQHHRGAGKGPVGSITSTFIENDFIQYIGKDSQHINPDLFKNPVYIVSERIEKFDRQEQRMEEGIRVDKTFSSSNTFYGPVMLLGLSAFLWAGFFYFRNKRLEVEGLEIEESVFQGKDNKIITFENIIIQFKRNELSFKEAELLLINNFTFTQLVAEEILLKL